MLRAAVFSSQAFVTQGLREANRTVMTHHLTDDAYGRVERPRRRYGLVAGLAAALLLVGYWLSPYVAATRFALAVQSGDSAGAIARMDVAGLRNSFARQIVQAYLARNPQLPIPGVLHDVAVFGDQIRVFRDSPPEPWRVVNAARLMSQGDPRMPRSMRKSPSGLGTRRPLDTV